MRIDLAKHLSSSDMVELLDLSYQSIHCHSRNELETLILSLKRLFFYEYAVCAQGNTIELLEAKGLLVGSSTHNNDMLLSIAAFMEDLKGLRPTGKIGAAFGSHGWAGRAVERLGQALQEAGVEVGDGGFSCQFAPDEDELAQAVEFGRRFARKLKTG